LVLFKPATFPRRIPKPSPFVGLRYAPASSRTGLGDVPQSILQCPGLLHPRQDIRFSLCATDWVPAKRRLDEEIKKAAAVDRKVGKMSLEELLRLYEERLSQYAPKSIASRQPILKIFMQRWPHDLNISVHSISAGQLEMWLASRRANFKNAAYNEYARFLRHLFELALKFRVIAVSPAAGLKGLRVETPIRTTPAWKQFLALVSEIRSQRFNAEAEDSADLVEFMGLAGVGTAECATLLREHMASLAPAGLQQAA